MSQPADVSIATHFADLEAPRLLGKTRHRLLDMVVIAISAIICHADDGVSVAEFGRSKEDWFRGFL
ncbi:MAG: transposase family protein, partial [Candidatus Competibacterales bacterium]